MTGGCCLLLLASHRGSMGGSHHQTTQLCATEKPAAIHHKNLQCGRQANKARSGGWNLSASPPSSQLGEGQLVKESDPTTAGMGNAGKAMTHSCSLSANPITSHHKGRIPLPKRMNFQKSSKRPLTPPSFSESYIADFATKL